jgi:hypothetical protein
MGTTPVYAFRYPASSVSPNVPVDMQNLALDVEAKFVTVDASVSANAASITAAGLSSGTPRGRLASSTRAGASATFTAETILDSSSFTAVSGRRYSLSMAVGMVGVAATNGTSYTKRVRYASGGTVTTAGTLASSVTSGIATSGNFEPHQPVYGEFVAPSSGTFTIGWSAQSAGGTIRSDGGVYWIVRDEGV